jgi:hypothetical protein
MKSRKTLYRVVGLIALLNLVPFVRGCDDVEGLHQTAGFPIPFFAYSSSSFDLSVLRASPLGINIALLALLICLLVSSRSKVGVVGVSWRFRLAVVGLAVLLAMGNVFVFIPLMLLCVGLAEVFNNISMVPTMDILARIIFAPLLAVCYLIARDTKKKGSNSELNPTNGPAAGGAI